MMQTATAAIDVKGLQKAWTAFDRIAHLRPIRSDKEYERTVALMNTLLDVAGDDENHPMSGLLDLVSDLVEDYDTAHFAPPAAEPKDALQHLIEMRGLRQSDLAEVIPQSNLSAILAGKRKISATLAGKFAKFFDVSPAVFIPA
jgi:HTH-type transcriptional regulator / antitoxin HigA